MQAAHLELLIPIHSGTSAGRLTILRADGKIDHSSRGWEDRLEPLNGGENVESLALTKRQQYLHEPSV